LAQKFSGVTEYHILGVGSFFKPHPADGAWQASQSSGCEAKRPWHEG